MLTITDWLVVGLPVIGSILGAYVSLRPPKRHLLWFFVFVISGVLGVTATLLQIRASRSEAADEKRSAKRDRDALLEKIDHLQKEIGGLLPVPKSIDELRGMIDKPKSEKPKLYADLEIQFAGKTHLHFRLHNRSKTETARDPKYGFGIWNYSRANSSGEDPPNVRQPLPLRTRLSVGEFIHPNQVQGPWGLLEAGRLPKPQMPGSGDQLFGSMNISCLNCSRRHAYWIYFPIGQGGWYVEHEGKVQIPNPHREYTDAAQLEAMLDQFMRQSTRIPIPPASNELIGRG